MKSPPLSQAGSASAGGGELPFGSDGARAAAQGSSEDPIRILGGGGHAFPRRLLEAAGDDGIPEASLRRLAGALSVPLPPPPAAPLASAGVSSRATRWASIRGYAASCVGLGAIGVLATQWPTQRDVKPAAPVHLVASQRTDAASQRAEAAGSPESAGRATTASSTRAERLQVSSPPQPAAAEAAAASVPAAAPVAATRRLDKPRRSARVGPPRHAQTESSLTPELRALEVAQRALRAGRVGEAERALAAHAQRFPRPALAVEAQLLEIDVLLARGQRGAAIERAQALVARPGAQHYRARLSALLRERTTVR